MKNRNKIITTTCFSLLLSLFSSSCSNWKRKNSHDLAIDKGLVEIHFTKKSPPLLVIDPQSKEKNLPKSFRSPQKTTKKFFEESQKKYGYSTTGLDQLRISGSGQYNEQTLEKMISKIKKMVKNDPHPVPIYFIDLRQENHLFINGESVTYYTLRNEENGDLSTEEILKKEKESVEKLRKLSQISLFKTEKTINKGEALIGHQFDLPIKSVQTEKELIESKGFIYKRVGLKDHFPPNLEQEKELLTFLKSLPAHSWVHFHCRAGKGRTTTVMMMADIIKNKKNVDFDGLIRRHHGLGGTDFFTIQSRQNPYIYYMGIRRLNFIYNFYKNNV